MRTLIVIALFPTAASGQSLVGHWTFEPGSELVDQTGNWGALSLNGATVTGGALRVSGLWNTATGWASANYNSGGAIGPDKTLVAWASLDDLDVTSGSPLALDHTSLDQFDAIVFAERATRTWMAGSTGFGRTVDLTHPDAVEDETGTVLQLAASYYLSGGNRRVRVCRDGVEIGDYAVGTAPTWSAGSTEVLFGPRHTTLGPNGAFDGSIHEARIYQGAMTCAQIEALAYTGPACDAPGAIAPGTTHPNAHVSCAATVGRAAWVDDGARVNPRVIVAPKATVEPDAVVGVDSKIGRRSVIGGEAVLGGDVTVAAEASVGARTVLGPGVVVGYGADVGADAVIGDGAVVGSLAEVEDAAVIDAAVEIGRAATVGSGAYIGEGASIGADVVVEEAFIGAQAALRRGARVEAYATVDEFAVIGRDAVVQSGATIGVGARVRAAATIAGCAIVDDYDTVSGTVVNGCAGGGDIVPFGASRRYADGTYASMCDGYLHPVGGHAYTGQTGDGVYTIQPSPSGPTFDVFCEMDFQNGGWTLVRREAQQPGVWHGADNLVASTSYGAGHTDPLINANWFSHPFATWGFSEFLFRTGDGARWIHVAKSEVYNGWSDALGCENAVAIIASHTSPTSSYTALWCKRPSNPEDPWISAENHGHLSRNVIADDDVHSMLYGEGGAGWNWHMENHQGANVFIR